MKKRILAIVAVFILLIPLMSLTAFAASDDSSGTIWDILDGIGNFFRDLRAQLKSSFNAIGDWFGKVINAIGKAISTLLNGIKMLFMPRDDYFLRFSNRISSAFNKKFGSFIYLANYLKSRFSSIGSVKDISSLLSFKFPKGQLLGGITLKLFTYVPYFASKIRFALSGSVTILTVIFCYRKVQSIIKA